MSRRLRVSRSGGFAGLRQQREVDLDDGTPRAAALAELVASGRLGATVTPAQPDRFVYLVRGDGVDVEVHEQDLSDDDRDLLESALRP